jgi:hypothetical protein
VNNAEPWARDRMPTSDWIGRTVFTSRPSIREPVSRIELRTTLACTSLKEDLILSLSKRAWPSAGIRAAMTFALAASIAL